MNKRRMPAVFLLAALLCPLASAADSKAKKQRGKEPSALDRYVAEAMADAPRSTSASAGSLWTPDARFAALALDLRASHVDDLLTIIVAESASAVASGTVKTQRNSSLNTSLTGLAGKTNPNGALANLANISNAVSLDGQGSTSRATSIATTLTARVTAVLPNGYLLVEGRKVVAVNAEEQVIAVRGIVRPVDLAPDNSITSDRLAQMEVSVNGKGVVGSAVRRPLFLYRLLLGLLPF